MKELKKFDGYEVFERRKRGIRVSVKGGRREETLFMDSSFFSTRVIKGKKMLFAYSGGKRDPHLDENAFKYVEDIEDYSFPEPSRLPDVRALDKTILNDDAEEFSLNFALTMEEAAISYDKRIKSIRHAFYEEFLVEERIINSLGVDYSFKRTGCMAYIELSASQDSEEEMGYSFRIGVKREDLSPKKLGEEAARRAVSLLGSKPLKTGFYDVVFTSETSSELLSLLSSSFSGENVFKGKSKLFGKLGERVFSPHLTIVDSNMEGVYPSPFDGEGTPGKEKIVVENGVLKGFLYDILWGKRCGMNSTGNAVRNSMKSPPTLGITNFYVKPGNKDISDFLRDAKEIFVVDELMGLHLADPITGDFSLGATGVFYKDGEPEGVKSVTISGNLLDVFSRISIIFSNLEFFGRTGSPPLFVEGIRVTGI